MRKILFSAHISQGTPIFLVENRLVFAPPRSKCPSKHVPQTDFPHNGFSLIEILVYSAIFAVVLILIVGTALGLSRIYGGFSARAALEQDGASVLERLTRTAREARRVDTGASTLGINPSVLVFTKTDGTGTTRFSILDGALRFADNGIEQGVLTSSKVSVDSFVARRITTGRSEGIKIELALHAGEDTASTTKKFYATTLLRNSY